MTTRTWPYGTRYRVKVEVSKRSMLMVVGTEKPVKGEAFILWGHGLRQLPTNGSSGWITFTKGGPTGGYWVFSKD